MTVVVPTLLDRSEPQLEQTLTLQPGQLRRIFVQVPDSASSAGQIRGRSLYSTDKPPYIGLDSQQLIRPDTRQLISSDTR